jgi:hypothetical protein
VSRLDPQPQQDDDPFEREAMDFLLAQREQAIAQGVSFIGAITGGGGPPRVVTHLEQDILPHGNPP